MKNGSKIDVDEMSIEHLRNVLKMIINSKKRQPKFELRGDIANMFNNEQELSELQAEYDSEDYGCRGI